MGQKSNLLTLRKLNPNINLNIYNSKNLINCLQLLKFLEQLFAIKGVWITEKTLNFLTNQAELTLVLYFRCSKVSSYKRRGLAPLILKEKASYKSGKNSIFVELFNKIFTKMSVNLLNFHSINLNSTLNKKLLVLFYTKTKRFVNGIFSRRFNLFIDFIKLNALLAEKKINISSYLLLLSQIFRSLSKRGHGRFLSFIKYLFKLLILETKNLSFPIKGFKFIISGKLKGKTRSSSFLLTEGSIPIQSFSKNIEFSKRHAYTLMGAFGLKIWIFRQ